MSLSWSRDRHVLVCYHRNYAGGRLQDPQHKPSLHNRNSQCFPAVSARNREFRNEADGELYFDILMPVVSQGKTRGYRMPYCDLHANHAPSQIIGCVQLGLTQAVTPRPCPTLSLCPPFAVCVRPRPRGEKLLPEPVTHRAVLRRLCTPWRKWRLPSQRASSDHANRSIEA